MMELELYQAKVGVLQLESWNSILRLSTLTVLHIFNLCIVKYASISDVRKIMDIADEVARFCNNYLTKMSVSLRLAY